MFERFSVEGRQAVVAASEAARELGHCWIGCEHLLVGLADRGGTPAAETLASLGAGSGHIPFTSRAKEALELSFQAALARKDRAIGSEHVLLGVLDQGANVGLVVLDHLGVAPETIRDALHERLERDAA